VSFAHQKNLVKSHPKNCFSIHSVLGYTSRSNNAASQRCETRI
jgi:hypothetical protein